jgi:hypothetical protein
MSGKSRKSKFFAAPVLPNFNEFRPRHKGKIWAFRSLGLVNVLKINILILRPLPKKLLEHPSAIVDVGPSVVRERDAKGHFKGVPGNV